MSTNQQRLIHLTPQIIEVLKDLKSENEAICSTSEDVNGVLQEILDIDYLPKEKEAKLENADGMAEEQLSLNSGDIEQANDATLQIRPTATTIATLTQIGAGQQLSEISALESRVRTLEFKLTQFLDCVPKMQELQAAIIGQNTRLIYETTELKYKAAMTQINDQLQDTIAKSNRAVSILNTVLCKNEGESIKPILATDVQIENASEELVNTSAGQSMETAKKESECGADPTTECDGQVSSACIIYEDSPIIQAAIDRNDAEIKKQMENLRNVEMARRELTRLRRSQRFPNDKQMHDANLYSFQKSATSMALNERGLCEFVPANRCKVRYFPSRLGVILLNHSKFESK